MLLTSQDKTQTVEFEIPKQYKKILVNLSGGADSALLLYMTIKYLKNNGMDDVEVNAMTCANSAKGNWNARKAAAVIHHVITRSEFENFNMHYAFYRDEQKGPYFDAVLDDLVKDDRIDCFMHGTTANPPIPTFVRDIRGNLVDLSEKALPDRDKKNYNLIGEKKFGDKTIGLINPWYNVDKKFIAHQYTMYGLVDDLLPLTRSCEFRLENSGIKKLLNNDKWENTPCGVCWWCLERKWAFGKF